MPRMNMVQAINLALTEAMEADPAVVVMGEDVGQDEGVFRVTAGLLERFGPQRVLDTPLAESGILGTAIGMAIAGVRPVAEMQFSGFSYLAIPQLEGNASRYRSRTQGQRTVPLVLRMPYGGGVRALEHHSESREATFAHMPGVKVVIPSGPRNARALMLAAIRDPDPVVFMEPKRSYRAFKEEVPEAQEVQPIGEARVVREGTELTVIAWGAMMRTAAEAVERVQRDRGTSIELIDLLTISPLDVETIAASVRKTGRCVVVQEAPRNLGLASEIIAQINDRALLWLEAPVARITGFDVVTPYFAREQGYIPTPERVVDGLLETIDF
jgi:pyruvate dehydrogenase E1 component beta subunit